MQLGLYEYARHVRREKRLDRGLLSVGITDWYQTPPVFEAQDVLISASRDADLLNS